MTMVWPSSRTAWRMKARISAPRAAVEVAGGLVGEDDRRAAGQGAGHGDALLLAAGELAGPVVEAVGEADGVDDLVEPCRVGLAAGQVHGQRDVLDRGQRRHQVERLEDEADAVAAQLGELASLSVARSTSPMNDLAAGEVVEPGQAVHERRLARARRPHDGGEAAGVEVDVDAVEGADVGVAAAVDLGRADGPGGRRREVHARRWRVTRGGEDLRSWRWSSWDGGCVQPPSADAGRGDRRLRGGSAPARGVHPGDDAGSAWRPMRGARGRSVRSSRDLDRATAGARCGQFDPLVVDAGLAVAVLAIGVLDRSSPRRSRTGSAEPTAVSAAHRLIVHRARRRPLADGRWRRWSSSSAGISCTSSATGRRACSR